MSLQVASLGSQSRLVSFASCFEAELAKKHNSRIGCSKDPQIAGPSSNPRTMPERDSSRLKKNVCLHTYGSVRGMCVICGAHLDEVAGPQLQVQIHKDLQVSSEETVRLRNLEMKDLLSRKKLCLVLDLDHTLVHSKFEDLTQEEEYLKGRINNSKYGSLFMWKNLQLITKLRPFVHKFLKQASEIFKLYIYTMADRSYALQMAKVLDPEEKYFGNRVISRDDSTCKDKKMLDLILVERNAIIILDDTESVWEHHKENLFLAERYIFFASRSQQHNSWKSLSQLKIDEDDRRGFLATVLKKLRQVHHSFFEGSDEDAARRDVRQVLQNLRNEILKDCRIVFSSVFPTNCAAENQEQWKMAEQMGATCLRDVDESVTHVVSLDAGTEKSCWAVKSKKFLVHLRWLEAAYFLWEKQPEECFPVKGKPKRGGYLFS